MKSDKKIIYWVLGSVAFLFVLTNVMAYVLRYGKPNFQDNLAERAIENKRLMDRIGGYKNYEFSYPSGDVDRDSLHFELIIYGGDSLLTYNGWAYKTISNEWTVKRIDSTIIAY